MTLEDISILFGDPVELSFEQALNKQEQRDEIYQESLEVKEEASEQVGSISDK